MDLLKLDNDGLRRFIQSNQVSFPAEAPVFHDHSRADIGWRLAILYFVRRWSLSRIANRYSFTRERAGQIVKHWWVEAVRAGYIQEVPPDPFGLPDGGRPTAEPTAFLCAPHGTQETIPL